MYALEILGIYHICMVKVCAHECYFLILSLILSHQWLEISQSGNVWYDRNSHILQIMVVCIYVCAGCMHLWAHCYIWLVSKTLSLPFFLESSESIELTNFLFHCPCSIPLRIAKTYTDMTETSHHKSICLETLSLLQVKKDGLFNHKTLFKNQSSNSF